MKDTTSTGCHKQPPKTPTPPVSKDGVDEPGDGLRELGTDLLARVRFWIVMGWVEPPRATS